MHDLWICTQPMTGWDLNSISNEWIDNNMAISVLTCCYELSSGHIYGKSYGKIQTGAKSCNEYHKCNDRDCLSLLWSVYGGLSQFIMISLWGIVSVHYGQFMRDCLSLIWSIYEGMFQLNMISLRGNVSVYYDWFMRDCLSLYYEQFMRDCLSILWAVYEGMSQLQ